MDWFTGGEGEWTILSRRGCAGPLIVAIWGETPQEIMRQEIRSIRSVERSLQREYNKKAAAIKMSETTIRKAAERRNIEDAEHHAALLWGARVAARRYSKKIVGLKSLADQLDLVAADARSDRAHALVAMATIVRSNINSPQRQARMMEAWERAKINDEMAKEMMDEFMNAEDEVDAEPSSSANVSVRDQHVQQIFRELDIDLLPTCPPPPKTTPQRQRQIPLPIHESILLNKDDDDEGSENSDGDDDGGSGGGNNDINAEDVLHARLQKLRAPSPPPIQ